MLNAQKAISADADGEDLIIKSAKGIKDGLYNIKDGKLFKYKANGGTVRTYPIVPSAEAEWIPCSERLPSEKDGQVLVTKRGEVRIATYSEFSGTWYVGEMCAVGGEDPIAWKPLPKPYKGCDTE